MPANYTGNAAGAAALRTDPTITEPVDTDALNAASVNTALSKMADEIAALKEKVAYLSGADNTGTAGNPGAKFTGGAGNTNGVEGYGTGANGDGVTGSGDRHGVSGDGGLLGVSGTSSGAAGVRGSGTSGASGTEGYSDTGVGVYGSSTSGYGVEGQGNATKAGLAVRGVAGDPAGVANGDIWLDTTSGKLRKRSNGASSDL